MKKSTSGSLIWPDSCRKYSIFFDEVEFGALPVFSADCCVDIAATATTAFFLFSVARIICCFLAFDSLFFYFRYFELIRSIFCYFTTQNLSKQTVPNQKHKQTAETPKILVALRDTRKYATAAPSLDNTRKLISCDVRKTRLTIQTNFKSF